VGEAEADSEESAAALAKVAVLVAKVGVLEAVDAAVVLGLAKEKAGVAVQAAVLAD
jgi:hypothetical protein